MCVYFLCVIMCMCLCVSECLGVCVGLRKGKKRHSLLLLNLTCRPDQCSTACDGMREPTYYPGEQARREREDGKQDTLVKGRILRG